MQSQDAVLSRDLFFTILPGALHSLFATIGKPPPADTPSDLVMQLRKEFDLLCYPDLDEHGLPKLLTRAGIKIEDNGVPPNIARRTDQLGTFFRYRVRCGATTNITGQERTVHAALLALLLRCRREKVAWPSGKSALSDALVYFAVVQIQTAHFAEVPLGAPPYLLTCDLDESRG